MPLMNDDHSRSGSASGIRSGTGLNQPCYFPACLPGL